jgi:hypothetical protein
MTVHFVNLQQVTVGLARIRRLRRIMWIVWLSGVPLMALVGGLLDSPSLIAPLSVIWMGAYIVTSVRVVSARCPPCGELYHLRWPFGGGGVLSQRCRNCGLGLRGEADV